MTSFRLALVGGGVRSGKSAFAAHLAESRGDHHEGAHAFAAALLGHAQHELLRDGEHRQVHGPGDVKHGGVSGYRVNGTRLRVDGVDRAREPVLQQVGDDLIADGSRGAAGADHRDRTRSEDSIQAGFHAQG